MNWLVKLAMSIPFDILSEDDFTYRDENDDFFYHVTPENRLDAILEEGIRPNSSPTIGGWYQGYSKGKAFFIERSSVKWWIDRIEEHLFHEFDDPPGIVVLRFPKSWVGQHEEDLEGTQDSHKPSWFTTETIPREGLE